MPPHRFIEMSKYTTVQNQKIRPSFSLNTLRICQTTVKSLSYDTPAWEVSEAPERWLELLKNNTIGIKPSITRLEGKLKISEEMQKGD